MSKKVLLIGAGGVAGVAAAKMAQNPEVFGELLIASRTESRCRAIKEDIERRVANNWNSQLRNLSTSQLSERQTLITTVQIDLYLLSHANLEFQMA